MYVLYRFLPPGFVLIASVCVIFCTVFFVRAIIRRSSRLLKSIFARLKPKTIYIARPATINEDIAEIKKLEAALHAVNNPTITIIPKPLLNGEEREIYSRIKELLAVAPYSQFLLMAQVSLGELFNTRPFGDHEAAAAYYAFNARRSDLVIIDREGNPVLIVEYQGGGHYKKTYYLRDEIKRRVFQRAKIRALEIAGNLTPQEAAARVREQLDAILPPQPELRTAP
jgi:hypothetical protein